MCTLTFIPNNDEFIITSNRDEHISRGLSSFPISKNINTDHVFFPQDPKAGGTWIAASVSGVINVLLNGAFKKHKHLPPYRKSRGIILLETYHYSSLKLFQKEYDLANIEPFTLVQFNIHNKTIEELRWDGQTKHYQTLDFSTNHIWSSATLYNESTRNQRIEWFNNWLKKPKLTPKRMLEFHQFGGQGDSDNSITMNRGNGLKTVSITQVYGNTQKSTFTHQSLMNGVTINLDLNK